MKKELTLKGFIFSIILSIAIFLSILFGMGIMKSCSSQSDQLDSLSNRIKIERVIMRDTIFKYDTIKERARIVYVAKRDTLWKYSPDAVDSVFNQTFPRDSLDSTDYSTGFTQLRKAVDSDNRRIRDSISNAASEVQVKTCTTTVSKIIEQVDSTKKVLASESKITWKMLGVAVIVTATLSFIAGLAAN
ncbi:MAG: hypothetical protein WC358_08750 [Ignavibacteria bacterium]|jgi:hypothetical protein